MTTRHRTLASTAIAIMCVTVGSASEYLGNNQRSGYVHASVPASPVLLWTYKERHPPRTAWPEPFGELQFIDFDYADQVTIGDGLAYFGSSADHTVRALDIAGGEEQWAFHTEGAVRFAPVLHFMEPEDLKKGERVFGVLINGKRVLAALDIVAEAGAPLRALVKDVTDLAPCTTVEVALKPVTGRPPLLCGIELLPHGE